MGGKRDGGKRIGQCMYAGDCTPQFPNVSYIIQRKKSQKRSALIGPPIGPLRSSPNYSNSLIYPFHPRQNSPKKTGMSRAGGGERAKKEGKFSVEGGGPGGGNSMKFP